MKTKQTNAGAVSAKTINYQFTAVPTKLYYCCDTNCKAMFFTLLQMSDKFGDNNGWFDAPNSQLSKRSGLSKNLVLATLDGLFKKDIIEINSVGFQNGKHSNRIRLKKETFLKYEPYSFDDIDNNPDLKIKQSQYKNNFVPSYIEKCKKVNTKKVEKCKKVNTNIDNKNIKNNNIDNTSINYSSIEVLKTNNNNTVNILEQNQNEYMEHVSNDNSNKNLNLVFVSFPDNAQTPTQNENKNAGTVSDTSIDKLHTSTAENVTEGKYDVVKEQRNLDTKVDNQEDTQSNVEVIEIIGDTILDRDVQELNTLLDLLPDNPHFKEYISRLMKKINSHLTPSNGKVYFHCGYEDFKDRYNAIAV